MWRTPRGKELARKIAFREISLQEILGSAPSLLMTEWTSQGAFRGKPTPEEEELMWKMFREGYDLYMAGKIATLDFLPLGLTWKGVSGPLGWGGVSKKLDRSLYGPMSYMFGHRYLTLKRQDDARRFFEAARDDASRPPGHPVVRRLAEGELKKLQQK
jgi:hypothetical protein